MDSETLNLLRRIGLNQYESKTYFSLLNAGPTSASEIGSLADIPRPRTYDVLDKLEKKGFISIQPGRPTKFKAIGLIDAVDFLKDKRKEEFDKSIEEIEELRIKLSQKIKTAKPEKKEDADDYVWVMKDKKSLHSKIESLIQSAKDNILIATTDSGLKHKMEAFEPHLRKASKRGVAVRIVSPLTDADLTKKVSEFADVVKRNHNHRFMVIDNDVVLFLTPEEHEREVGTWIKSPYVANNFRCLF